MERDSLLVDGQILLYGDVGDPWGWGDGFTPTDVAQALALHGPGDVTVRINSGGGVAFDGVAIYSLLKAHAGAVAVAIDGIAASAASLIAMAGDTIEMRVGSMMMIHDAAGVTFGDAAAHERSATTLDKLSEQYAAVYAKRAGQSKDSARELMKAETWLSAEDAIAQGFATGTLDAEALPSAAFDYTLYARAPETLPRRPAAGSPAALAAVPRSPAAPAAVPSSPAAHAALAQEKPDMSEPVRTEPAAPVAPAAAPVKDWAITAYQIAGKAGLSLADTNSIVARVETLDSFKDAVIDAVATKPAERPAAHPSVSVGGDGRDKYISGIVQAVAAMAGLEKFDPANEFNGISPMGIAQAVLQQNSVRASFDKRKIVAAAITHSSSDFANITSNLAEKALLKGFDEQPETYPLFTGKGVLQDFKQGRRIGLNSIASLPTIGENGEFQYLTTGDRAEPVQLSTAGGIISISRQAIINDDLGAFTDLPRKLGRSARRTIGDAVFAVLLSNPNMSDSVALFNSAHKNTATGGGSALSTTSLITAKVAMSTQTDRTATATALNIDPAFLITAKALEPLANQLMNSTAEVGAANAGVANRVAKMALVIADARIDRSSNGSTKWFMAADPMLLSTIEVQYLNGVETPYIEQGLEFDVDGVRIKVRHDFGVKALQWEGLYYAVGQ